MQDCSCRLGHAPTAAICQEKIAVRLLTGAEWAHQGARRREEGQCQALAKSFAEFSGLPDSKLPSVA